jgi:hypothetical protein
MTIEERLKQTADNTIMGMEIANDITGKVLPGKSIPDLTGIVVCVTGTGEWAFCASMDSGEAIAVLRKVIAELEKEQN